MASGKQVYNTIEAHTDTLEIESQTFGGKITSAQEQIRADAITQEELYIKLAKIYLPEMDADDVQRTLKEVRADVQGILDRKNQRRTELEYLIGDTTQRRASLSVRLKQVTETLDEKARQREETQIKINEELSLNQDYLDIKTNADQAQKRLEQGAKRLETFEQEAKEKLAVYEANKVFMYLVETKYPNREGSVIKRAIDSWTAQKINFRENKKNYDFLKVMPQKMKEEIDRQKVTLESYVAELRATEQQAAQKYGLPAIVEEVGIITKTRQDMLRGVGELDKAVAGYAAERDAMNDTRGKYYEEAVGRLKSFLTGNTIDDLRKRAQQTPDATDDGYVEKIDELNYRIADRTKSLDTLRAERKSVETKLAGLREIAYNFKSRDYESSRSTFNSGFNISDLLLGYMLGNMSSHDVNRHIENNQHFKPVETSYSRSYSHDSGSSYNSGSSSWSHSSGSSGFSSGGGFGGGGGHSTGGGF
ncbi:hypothetical protein HYT23_00910 [Candidatus Pacearchaeota archaeon]|nr:hypothetical protein [Candidatus Pacearchaeota archaeon]